eukprot:GHVH01004555.1.p1 GENE.GHVH01004555.1~~GHVH01004555.1.p1  ORF type:complete len:404 (-),score=45.90 GHVH01004555.1:105-1316(-)
MDIVSVVSSSDEDQSEDPDFQRRHALKRIRLVSGDGSISDDDELTSPNAKRFKTHRRSGDRDFQLSWGDVLKHKRIPDKERLYRETLGSLFDVAVPFFEQSYENILTKLLSKCNLMKGGDGIPTRIEMVRLLLEDSLSHVSEVSKRQMRKKKRRPFLSHIQLSSMAKAALMSSPTHATTLDSPLLPPPEDPIDVATPKTAFDERFTLPVMTEVLQLSDDDKTPVHESNDLEVFTSHPVDAKPLDTKVICRRVKRDIAELRARNEVLVGAVLSESMTCNICFRQFLDKKTAYNGKYNEAVERIDKIGIEESLNQCGADQGETYEELDGLATNFTMNGVWTTKCGHIFCKECLESYFEILPPIPRYGVEFIIQQRIKPSKKPTLKKPCPVCKAESRFTDSHRVYF